MRRTTLLATLFLLNPARVDAQAANMGHVVWKHFDVVTRIDNDGRAEVAETHDVATTGDVWGFNRDFNFGADQSADVHGVFRLGPDGSKTPLKNAPIESADCYQAYAWGLQISIRAEHDMPIEATTRRYLIEYTLRGAITPAWDLAAGPLPLDSGTLPRNPLTRAAEVFAAWRDAWTQLDRNYRFDHDVVSPTRGSPDGLLKVNYRLEYADAWQPFDKDREIGVSTQDVDYRVQRVLRYLPGGRPREADVQNAALRIGAVVAPLILGSLLGLFFLAADRLTRRAPRGDRARFEKLIASEPREFIAARFGGRRQAPSFEAILLRMAAQRKLSIAIESPAADDTDARVRLRLATSRDKLEALERKVIETIFGEADTVSTADIQERYRGREFEPDLTVSRAFEKLAPKATFAKRRPVWSVFHLSLMAAGVALLVKSLVDRTMADPIAIVGGLVPGNLLASLLPAGAPTRRPSILAVLIGIVFLGLLGAALALSPNTPLSGVASLGLGLLGVGHCAGYLARLPRSSQSDLDLEAARRWALGQLRRPHPALLDAWIESLEAMGAGPAIARWRKRYGGGQTGAPDMADLGVSDLSSGPPFTGEPRPTPSLPPGWADGFAVYGDESEDGSDDNDQGGENT